MTRLRNRYQTRIKFIEVTINDVANFDQIIVDFT